METNFDNSWAEKSWALIQSKIEELNELKNDPASIHEMLTIAKQLDNLLRLQTTKKYENITSNTSSKIAVVLPAVYPEVKTILIENKEKDVPGTPTADTTKAEIAVLSTAAVSTPLEASESTPEEKLEESLEKVKAMETHPAPTQVSETPEVSHEEQAISEEPAVTEAPEPEASADTKPAEQPTDTVSEKVYVAPPSSNDLPTETIAPKEEDKPAPKKQFSLWESYSSDDIPTLAHQDPVSQPATPSFYSAQEEEKSNQYTELSKLPPIKDLKKAISINDRYLFINELFRGDESMYERSIKTINNFNIYQEAQYWIDRELKLKLGWDEKSQTVRQFNNLVERRFA